MRFRASEALEDIDGELPLNSFRPRLSRAESYLIRLRKTPSEWPDFEVTERRILIR